MSDQSFKDTVILLRCIYPYTKFFSRVILHNSGYLNLHEDSVAILSRKELPPWSSFYEHPKRIQTFLAMTFLGNKFYSSIKDDLVNLDERTALRYRNILKRVMAREAVKMSLPKVPDDIQLVPQSVYDRWFRRLSIEDRNHHVADVYITLYTLVLHVFNYVALMTYGASMCDLVARAKAGDEEALLQAVQIDKTTLFGIPYFRDRLSRASITNDATFLYKLGQRIQSPPLAGKIRHKRLMVVFAMLDDEGFLERPISELFEACEQIGVYGSRFDQYDDDSLRKRLTDYIKRSGRKIRV